MSNHVVVHANITTMCKNEKNLGEGTFLDEERKGEGRRGEGEKGGGGGNGA